MTKRVRPEVALWYFRIRRVLPIPSSTTKCPWLMYTFKPHP